MDTLQRWFEQRVAFFRRKAGSPHRRRSVDFQQAMTTLDDWKGEWEGLALDWTAWGGVARPFRMRFGDSEALVDERPWRRVGDVLMDAEEDSNEKIQLVGLGDEILGVATQSGAWTSEIYLVRVDSGRCQRTRFTEAMELSLAMLLSIVMTAPLLMAETSTWWLAVMGPVGAALYLRTNIRQRREYHLRHWTQLFRMRKEAIWHRLQEAFP